MRTDEFEIVKFPKSRIATFDVGKIGRSKHHVCAFIEVDVTDPKKLIRNLKSTSDKQLSFTAWFIKCISTAISEYKEAHGLLYGKNKLLLFKDVDIAMPVEKKVGNKKVPLPILIKNTNSKSIYEIHQEIHSAKDQRIQDESDFVLGKKQSKLKMNLFYSMPQWLRMRFWHSILRNPFKRKQSMGTVVITSIGMISRFPGWVLPKAMHNLCFGLGSIVEKPWVVNKKIEIRDILHLTILLDHDVIDGAPTARFVTRLVELLESGYGLQGQAARK
jgi:pyruvate/2-oxoglutarate dehydrogenase complex dihydrolipoamide acyltransferase (E2) component